MSIIYFCLNKAIFSIALVKLLIVLFSFNAASAFRCDSTSENNVDVVVVFNDSDLISLCKPIPKCREPISRKEISKSDLEEELAMMVETKSVLLKKLPSPSRYPKHSELLERHIFKYVKNLLYPDFLKREKDNPDYKYIVLFAESVKTSSFDKSGGSVSLTTYQLNSDIATRDIISANLWFFTGNERVGMFIREVEKYEFNAKTKTFIFHQLRMIRKKWYKVSMTSIVKKWSPNRVNTIEISCGLCEQHIKPDEAPYGLLPFIVLESKIHPYQYGRLLPERNENNNYWIIETSEICKRPITIDFKSLGWSGWIVYPERFNTNYCKGTCVSNIDKSYCSNPISIKEVPNIRRYEYAWRPPATTCCEPVRFSNLEIGYMITPFIAVLTTLPNMTVEECGCIWSPDF